MLDIQYKSINDLTAGELYKIVEEGEYSKTIMTTPKMALRELWYRAGQSSKEKKIYIINKINKLFEEIDKEK